jgi:membrane-bound serine protease (ClpP class)
LGIGGLIGLVCFALFFWSRFLGGTADWFEVILFLAGVLLLLVEIFVIPGFGVWGGTGILLILSSLVLAGQIPIFNQLLLQPQPALAGGNGMSSEAVGETVISGRVVRVGDRGLSESPLRPAGRIRMGDDFVDVVSDGSYVDAGQPVQVVDVRGNRIVVRQIG